MKEFDYNGLVLAQYQGKLFERSYELDCSSSVFIRRFRHSELLMQLDENNSAILSLDPNEGLQSIMNQFGRTDYGRIKYPMETLFWIGYMYRYIAYTREQSTKLVMNLFKIRQMEGVYYSFHTQSPEWCVGSLLDMNNLSEDVFDNNSRLKRIIEAKGLY